MSWFDYARVSNGGFMPRVNVHLVRGGIKSVRIPFLVDSGAVQSVVPRAYVSSLLPDVTADAEQDTGAQDANGKPIKGVPIDFHVTIVGADGMVSVPERVWVSGGGYWGLLGQTWFEKFAVRFHNFAEAPRGRRFAMHASTGVGADGRIRRST